MDRAMRLLRRGKVKDVYEDAGDTLRFVFSDRISVFDKIVPTLVPHKGETLCRTSAHWFEVAESLGILTHYIDTPSPTEMRVKRVEVVREPARVGVCTRSYLIPLEFICRHYVAGSLLDRLRSGALDPVDLGFPRGHEPRAGERLPEPLFEITTKLEAVDRRVDVEKALRIGGLTPEELGGIKATVLRLDERIAADIGPRGLIHADGKKEFAFDSERTLMLVDTFGTADEDRFWDAGAYEEGRLVELSKERVRQYYRSTGYHERLERARAAGEGEPEIPPLPEGVRDEVGRVYIEIFERLTGQSFR